jgi:hypothetical protein
LFNYLQLHPLATDSSDQNGARSLIFLQRAQVLWYGLQLNVVHPSKQLSVGVLYLPNAVVFKLLRLGIGETSRFLVAIDCLQEVSGASGSLIFDTKAELEKSFFRKRLIKC